MLINTSHKIIIFAALGSLAIGFYDGILVLVQVVSLSSFYSLSSSRFFYASALSKIGNFMTNLAALKLFIPAEHIFFQLGFMMAAAILQVHYWCTFGFKIR